MTQTADMGAPALRLDAPLGAEARPLDGEWRVMDCGAEPSSACADPDLDDSAWESVRLPHLHHSSIDRDTLWYRHRFNVDSSPGDARLVLRFGGAFYETRVWLNGVPLGEHAGYFQPFGFDVTDALSTGANVLAVRCRFPVEARTFKRKTALAGVFADWDCKPYPSTFYPHLPAPYKWTVPLGLWQPVHLQTSGPVLVEWLNLFPHVLDAGALKAASAQVRIVAQLRNLTPAVQDVRMPLEIAPHNFAGAIAAREEYPITLAAGESRRVEFDLTLPEPRLWSPWTHGHPWLYRATLSLIGAGTVPRPITQVFGVRTIQAVVDEKRWEWWLNGRRIFPKGSNYISDFHLDRVSVEALRRDLALARAANLDLLRVHAHIGSPEFYRLCDEQGIMVMCDFPMIWTYAFDLPSGEQAVFEANVETQVEDMVNLLGSHPSIVLWSIHNEPPWTPDGSFLGGELHAAQTNRATDERAAERVRALDPTRPVIAASGQYDQHLYHGWYTGNWQDNRSLRPTFPTEFGVQALPNLDSPFWGTVKTNWPIDTDDPSWAHAGYQSLFWISPGVGAPAQYASLVEYAKESQAYQAFYIRYTIDQWRRYKFSPVGGYIHFLFTDGWPAITWSVLDYYRFPKAGYDALAAASRPTHVCIDLEEGFAVEGAFHLAYAQGARFKAGLYLVNDDYRLSGRVQLAWWLERRHRGRLRTWLRRWFASRVTLELPRADQGARLIRSVEIPLVRAGEYAFCTRLTHNGHVLDENRYELRVGAGQAVRRAPRRVPDFLVSRVYEVGSLRHTADGFALRLRNPAMPVLLQRLVDLRVDGAPIDPAQVEVIRGGQSRGAATITPESPLEFASGEHLTVVVREHPLALGMHELEAAGQLLGFGEIAARWRDRLV